MLLGDKLPERARSYSFTGPGMMRPHSGAGTMRMTAMPPHFEDGLGLEVDEGAVAGVSSCWE